MALFDRAEPPRLNVRRGRLTVVKPDRNPARVVIHPPIETLYRAFRCADEMREAKPFLERCRDIVAETDLLIAAPAQPVIELRSATWWTIRYAIRAGRPVKIINPDGKIGT
jgi:hypothetical protein